MEWAALVGVERDWQRQESCLRIAADIPFDGRNSKGTFDERIYTYMPHQLLSELYEGLGLFPQALEQAEIVSRFRPRSASILERITRLESVIRRQEIDRIRQAVELQRETGPIRWIHPGTILEVNG